MKDFRRGQIIRAFVEGEHRELVVDTITSNGTVAQCYWTEGRSKRFVMLFVGAARKAEGPAAPVRTHV